MHVTSASARNTFLNDKYVFTSDGTMIGNVVLSLNESFLVRSIEGTLVTYYDIPLSEIKQILGDCVTLHSFKNEIIQRHRKPMNRIWNNNNKRVYL
ncbi:MAG: hypothetical protein ACR2IS_00655 [Nitrososphaeraceae archaeon]